MLIEPLWLEALAAVVREGSFEKAAAQLHVSPSAVSQRIRSLESRCGGVVVVRGSPCVPTALGHQLCRHAERLDALDRALRDSLPDLASRDPVSRRPHLPVAVNADSLATWFVQALARFDASGADTLVQVRTEDEGHTLEALRRAEVCAVVTTEPTPVQGCHVTALGALRYRATASPDWVRRWFPHGIDADSLSRAPSLRFSTRDPLQSQWAERLLGQSVTLPSHMLPSTHAFVEATMAGLGWALNPEVLVAAQLERGELVELVPDTPLDVPLYWQVTRLDTPGLRRLGECVSQEARRVLLQGSAGNVTRR